VGRRFDPDRAHLFHSQEGVYNMLRIRIEYLFVLILCFTTLIVTPKLNLDPVNLPKLLLLFIGSAILTPYIVYQIYSKKTGVLMNSFVTLNLGFVCFLCLAVFENTDVSFHQQIWGVFGRNTGLIAYLCLTIIALAAYAFIDSEKISFFMKSFRLTSYVVIFYSLIQWAGLDPIDWESRGQVGFSTLGNINFSSAFLGISSFYFIFMASNEKRNISSRIWYLSLVALNIALIWISGSLQGLLLTVCGIWFKYLFESLSKRGSLRTLIYFVLPSTSIGFFGILGLFGKGPLSFLLRQETLIFRTDYWITASKMTEDNLVNGVGIDSYGDFYRRYRSITAILRTDSQRVTDTAHNVFLDISAGAGLIPSILLLSVFLISLIRAFNLLRRNRQTTLYSDFNRKNSELIFCMTFMFFFQLLFSINQIGIAVWTWAFLGILTRTTFDLKMGEEHQIKATSSNKSRLKQNNVSELENSLQLGVKKGLLVLSILLLITSVAICQKPLNADRDFLKSFRGQDFSKMTKLVESASTPSYYGELALERSIQLNLRNESLVLARLMTQKNPNRFYPWYILFSHIDSTQQERSQAARQLQDLDPLNTDLKKEIAEAMEKRT
jgi:hypothetical protein